MAVKNEQLLSFKKKLLHLHRNETTDQKLNRLFVKNSIWKTMIIMFIPAFAMVFIYGVFSFVSIILAVNWGGPNYVAAHIHDPNISLEHAETIIRTALGGFASPILIFAQALGYLFSRGIATRYAVLLGNDDIKKAQSTLANGLLTCVTVNALFIIIMHCVAPYWVGFEAGGGGNDLLQPYEKRLAEEYTKYIVYSFVFVALGETFVNIYRTEGHGSKIIIFVFLTLVVDIIANYLLMKVGHMGPEASSKAFMIAYAFETVLSLLVIMLDRKTHIRLSIFKHFKLDWRIISMVVALGMASFFRNFSLSLTSTLFQQAMGNLPAASGDVSYREYFADALPIMALLASTIYAILQAGNPIASYNYGARNYQRVTQTSRWVLLMASIYGVIIYVLINFAIGKPLMELSGVAADQIPHALTIMHIISAGLLVISVTIAAMNFFQSTQQPAISFVLAILRSVIFFIPLVYIFQAIAQAVGPTSLSPFWFCYPATWLSTSIVSGLMLWWGTTRLKKTSHYRNVIDHWFAKYQELHNFDQAETKKLAASSYKPDDSKASSTPKTK